MNSKTKTILSIILFIILIGSSTFLYNHLKEKDSPPSTITKDETSDSVSDNKPTLDKAPDFTLYNADGTSFKLSEMIGKPIVLNFWASWCPPCKEEMPHFDKLYQEFGQDVQFMMINATDGTRETIETASAYIAETPYQFPIFFDTASEGGTNYQVYYLPTTIFINADGYIVSSSQGMIDEATLRQGIDAISL